MAVTVVAEVGSNWRLEDWEASKGLAIDSISQAASSGAHAVKFQVLRAETLYSRTRARAQHDAVRPYQLPIEWLPELRQEATNRHIKLWASVWDANLVRPVAKYLDGLKIGSGDMVYKPMVDECLAAAKEYKIPLTISTGAATQEEVETLIDWIQAKSHPPRIVLMHCVSSYPAKAMDYNLKGGTIFRDIVDEIGLSDHTTSGALLAQLALALGYTVFEKHFIPDGASKDTPDAGASIGPEALKKYIISLAVAYGIMGKGRKEVAESERSERVGARRGVDGLRPAR